MKKYMLLTFGLCLFLVLITTTSKAEIVDSGSCGDNATWILERNGVLTITGTGELQSYSWYLWYKTYINSVIINEGITSINDGEFQQLSKLTTIKLPNSLLHIGNYAFADCTSLANVTLPENLISLGNRVFENCSSLVSINISDNISSIGTNCFNNCPLVLTFYANIGSTGAKTISRYGKSFREQDSNYSLIYFFSNEEITGLSLSSADKDIVSIDIPNAVTRINASAFKNCSDLMNISFSNNITSIGNEAFKDCSSLSSVILPDDITFIGDNAFVHSSSFSIYSQIDTVCAKALGRAGYSFKDKNEQYSLQYIFDDSGACGLKIINVDQDIVNIVIPEKVTVIPENTFINCNNLSDVIIPDSVISIGDSAFYNCSSLTNISLSSNLNSIGTYSFFGCSNLASIIIPDGLSNLGHSPFLNCPAVRYAKLNSDAAETLSKSDYSFRNPGDYFDLKYLFTNDIITGLEVSNVDKDLVNVILPDGITNIAKNTFYNNNSLTNISIPDSMISIGAFAFFNCKNLTNISIPDNVTDIGDEAFLGCPAILYANLFSKGAKALGKANYSFRDPLYDYDHKYIYTNDLLTGLEITNADKDIVSVIIPDGVTSIGNAAFQECSNLKNIQLPDSLINIGNSAFAFCNSLTDISIPRYVENIGRYAFAFSRSLKKIVFLGDDSINMTIADNIFPSDSTAIYCYMYSDIDNYCLSSGLEPTYLDLMDINTIRKISLPETIRLKCGAETMLTYYMFPNDGAQIIWESNNQDVCLVDNGVVTVLQPGEAVITASVGMVSANVTVHTYLEATDFSLNFSEEWIVAHDSIQISAISFQPEGASADISWISSDDKLATVDENGYVTSHKPGDVIITAITESGISQDCVLHLCYPVSAISLISPTSDIFIGLSKPVVANVIMRSQTCVNHLVSFTSSDDSIAVVDAVSGLVTGVSAGSVTITATAASGVTAACTLIVREMNVLTLPTSLFIIESEAFSGLTAVDAIRFPATVEIIAEDAFDHSDVFILAPKNSYAAQWARNHGFVVIEE